MPSNFLMSDMTWQDVQDALKRSDIVLFPVGSTEQHSTHLPLNNDIFTSFEISKRVAEKLAPETAVLVAPPLPFGLSSHHMGFPGTISFRVDTFIEAVKGRRFRTLISMPSANHATVLVEAGGSNRP